MAIPTIDAGRPVLPTYSGPIAPALRRFRAPTAADAMLDPSYLLGSQALDRAGAQAAVLGGIRGGAATAAQAAGRQQLAAGTVEAAHGREFATHQAQQQAELQRHGIDTQAATTVHGIDTGAQLQSWQAALQAAVQQRGQTMTAKTARRGQDVQRQIAGLSARTQLQLQRANAALRRWTSTGQWAHDAFQRRQDRTLRDRHHRGTLQFSYWSGRRQDALQRWITQQNNRTWLLGQLGSNPGPSGPGAS